jgi:hypothetical protein
MPTFKRHTSQKLKPVRRTFVRNKRPATPAPTIAKKPTVETETAYFAKAVEPVAETKPEVVKSPPKHADIMASLEETKQSFLSKVESPEEIKPPSVHASETEGEDDKEIEDIQNLIQQATKRLVELEQKATQVPPHEEEEEIEAFDGISNPTEQVEMLAAQLERSQREARELREKMLELEQAQRQEKEQMHKTIHTMRKDMYRAAPLHDTKFFSLSNELKDAIKAIETITETDLESIDLEAVATAPTLVLPTTNEPSSSAPTVKPQPQPVVNTPPTSDKPKEVVKDTPEEEVAQAKIVDPKKKKKKMLITGAAAVAVLVVLSGAFSLQMKAGSEVDDALVEEYLKQQTEGDVAGIATENPTAAGQAASTPPVQAQTQPTKFDQAQADVPFEQTVWDSFKEPIFGIEMEYPINAVNIIKTDSSITFIRKNGYIFKVQKVETALELEEYWKQIKATSLNYKVTPKDFAKQKSLHLELEDITDFPGDRYLVKMGDAIFDVWYATASEKFVQDDMKRVERMLSSVVFAGNDTAGN